jgi:hypothetical protein
MGPGHEDRRSPPRSAPQRSAVRERALGADPAPLACSRRRRARSCRAPGRTPHRELHPDLLAPSRRGVWPLHAGAPHPVNVLHRYREEAGAVLPVHVRHVDSFQVRFMNQGRGLNNPSRPLIPHAWSCNPPELLVNPRRQLLQRFPIAMSPSTKNLRGFRASGVAHKGPKDYSRPVPGGTGKPAA